MNRQSIEHTLWQEFFETTLSRGQERKVQIVEAAIQIIAKDGADSLTYDRIAERCKVTRQLVIHHFPDRTDLIRWGGRFVRAHMQNFAVVRIKQETSAVTQLKSYVKSTFDWIQAYPNYSSFWIYYYYYCCFKKEFKKSNSELVEMGHLRIEALIMAGIEENSIYCENPKATAKIIQNIITGSLISALTEDSGSNRKHLEDWTLASIQLLINLEA